eukprot:2014382-Rhodomonas_salina.1
MGGKGPLGQQGECGGSRGAGGAGGGSRGSRRERLREDGPRVQRWLEEEGGWRCVVWERRLETVWEEGCEEGYEWG